MQKKYKGVVIRGTFLAPISAESSLVKRYHIVDQKINAGMMAMYMNWWVCITKGEIVKEAHSTQNNFSMTTYGIILVRDYEAQQSTGERGGE